MLDWIDYRWWKFIHLIGVFGFLLSHGVSVSVLFRLRKERDRGRIRDLLALSGSTMHAMYLSLLVLLIGGIVATLQVYSFGQLWIWLSIAILVLVTAVMYMVARPYYRRIKDAVGARPSGVPRVSDEDLAERLTGSAPVIIAITGVVGLTLILWLMVFKPA